MIIINLQKVAKIKRSIPKMLKEKFSNKLILRITKASKELTNSCKALLFMSIPIKNLLIQINLRHKSCLKVTNSQKYFKIHSTFIKCDKLNIILQENQFRFKRIKSKEWKSWFTWRFFDWICSFPLFWACMWTNEWKTHYLLEDLKEQRQFVLKCSDFCE